MLIVFVYLCSIVTVSKRLCHVWSNEKIVIKSKKTIRYIKKEDGIFRKIKQEMGNGRITIYKEGRERKDKNIITKFGNTKNSQ